MASVVQVAKHLGLSTKRIRQLVEEGTIQKQPRGQYDLTECREAYLARLRKHAHGGGDHLPRDPKLAEIKRQLSEIDLEAAQLRLAIAEGRIVEIRMIADVVGRAYAGLRQQLISIGSRTADMCIACSTAGAVKQLVDNEIEQGLQDLRQTLFDPAWVKAAAKAVPSKRRHRTTTATLVRRANGDGEAGQ